MRPPLTSLLLLAAISIAIGSLLHLRLRQQFRGENLSEAAARPKIAHAQTLQLGWNIPGLLPTIAAVFEKEVRYLARSGPMLLTLIMPLFMLIIFRLGPASSLRHSNFFGYTPDMAFPSATAAASARAHQSRLQQLWAEVAPPACSFSMPHQSPFEIFYLARI